MDKQIKGGMRLECHDRDMKNDKQLNDCKAARHTEAGWCCLCGKEFPNHGHNPTPIANRGWCCDECYNDIVMPFQLHRERVGLP